jgi:hypothetical protein
MALIDLKKKTRIVLDKRALPQPPHCRVGLCIDISGSMHNEYQDGLVQETVDRLLAIAGTFDDNGEMEVWTFNQGYSTPPVARAADFGSYVKKEILDNPKVDKWGGTNYAPVMNAVLDTYFRGASVVTSGGLFGLFKKTEQQSPKDTHIPALCLFITDGDNSDAAKPRGFSARPRSIRFTGSSSASATTPTSVSSRRWPTISRMPVSATSRTCGSATTRSTRRC